MTYLGHAARRPRRPRDVQGDDSKTSSDLAPGEGVLERGYPDVRASCTMTRPETVQFAMRSGSGGRRSARHEGCSRQAVAPEGARPRSRLLDWALRLVLLAIVILAVAYWAWMRGAEMRAVEQMPEPERAALYERTLEELKMMCEPPIANGLEDRCQTESEFIALFPECQDECRRLLEHQRVPMRPR
jgi:hypothetical protein